MKLGSTTAGAIILFFAFAILLYIEVIPILFAGDALPPLEAYTGMPPQERFPFFGTQFEALPAWVKVWMAFQDIIIGASLFFVLWRPEAQVYALCFILSHLFVFASVATVPVALLTLNLAALSHWFWIPALIVLSKTWSSIDKRTGYGTWVTIAIAQLSFSLLFDIPDGLQLLGSLI